MSTGRVVVASIGGITASGRGWQSIQATSKVEKSAVKYVDWREHFPELGVQLGAPTEGYTPSEHWTRKQLRSMGRVSHLCVDAAEQALTDAGLLGDESITDGHIGVACGSSVGSIKDIGDMGKLLNAGISRNFNVSTCVRMVPHATAANIGIFFGLKGHVIPTSSACSSGSQGIGYVYEAIKYGMVDMALTGGGEELCPSEVYVFDSLYTASRRNGGPELTPCPYDNGRDGLVTGEGAGIFVLEELERVKRRGVKIYAEPIGYDVSSDGNHAAQPQKETMQKCMELVLQDAGITPDKVGYVNGHGTATEKDGIIETLATGAVFGSIPMSSQKSYLDHTLGACGTLEMWFTIEMMNSGWFVPTVNLNDIGPRCGKVDYILNDDRETEMDYVVSNNFAFGGVNTSLALKHRQTYQKPDDRFSHDEVV